MDLAGITGAGTTTIITTALTTPDIIQILKVEEVHQQSIHPTLQETTLQTDEIIAQTETTLQAELELPEILHLQIPEHTTITTHLKQLPTEEGQHNTKTTTVTLNKAEHIPEVKATHLQDPTAVLLMEETVEEDLMAAAEAAVEEAQDHQVEVEDNPQISFLTKNHSNEKISIFNTIRAGF